MALLRSLLAGPAAAAGAAGGLLLLAAAVLLVVLLPCGPVAALTTFGGSVELRATRGAGVGWLYGDLVGSNVSGEWAGTSSGFLGQTNSFIASGFGIPQALPGDAEVTSFFVSLSYTCAGGGYCFWSYLGVTNSQSGPITSPETCCFGYEHFQRGFAGQPGPPASTYFSDAVELRLERVNGSTSGRMRGCRVQVYVQMDADIGQVLPDRATAGVPATFELHGTNFYAIPEIRCMLQSVSALADFPGVAVRVNATLVHCSFAVLPPPGNYSMRISVNNGSRWDTHAEPVILDPLVTSGTTGAPATTAAAPATTTASTATVTSSPATATTATATPGGDSGVDSSSSPAETPFSSTPGFIVLIVCLTALCLAAIAAAAFVLHGRVASSAGSDKDETEMPENDTSYSASRNGEENAYHNVPSEGTPNQYHNVALSKAQQ